MSSKNRAPPENPCVLEQESSFKCLSQNNFDKDKCELFFVNYTNCQKFWTRVKQDRRRKGISPELPPASERVEIKNEYMKTKPNES